MQVTAAVSVNDVPVDLADFDYVLPPELIAQTPPERREGGRLMVLGRRDGAIRHAMVADVAGHLRAGDVLVVNDTRVRPARLFGRAESGAGVELLALSALEPSSWQCLGKPAKRLRDGARLALPESVTAMVEKGLGGGRYVVRFSTDDVTGLLERHGEVPLPPYIKRPDGPLPADRERYQTVFARSAGAVAAPTAGLHFSDALLERVTAAGVEIASLTLHVGPATFLPVRDEDVRRHHLDAEWARIPAATLDLLRRARERGGRVIAVGTTTTRALESAAGRSEQEVANGFLADAFIRPGFPFRVVDGLLTNFHLPRSTLLMLVSAFAGRDRVLAAYAAAVEARYRFYSYGDAMLIGE
jgi:S-adenosylmethionine:tRNA ribosyltransferase-isomerase